MIRKVLLWLCVVMSAFVSLPVSGMVASAAKYDMPYYIEVDINNQITTIYRTSDDAVMIQAICTTGTDEFYTPSGTFYLPADQLESERAEWYYFPLYDTYAKYATRIFRMILFHSVIFKMEGDTMPTQKSLDELGYNMSHGCVRLRVEDAKWIAEHCFEGTRVHIYRTAKRDEELRELLLSESYRGEAGENGMTYEQFIGMAEDENSLGRFSEGPEVLDLQYRLQSLGFFNGQLNGVYSAATVKAVRAFQRAEGLKDTGVVDQAVSDRIYASDATLGTLVPIEFSMSGPIVTRLQQGLAALHLYDGDVDSVYDGDVQTAVHDFQGMFGFDYDETCQPEVQEAVLNAAQQLQNVFEGGEYTSEMVTTEYDAARIAIDVSVRLRKIASTGADYLEKLEPNARMIVLEHDGDSGWAHVDSGENQGYIKDEYLEFYTYENIVMHYTSADGQTTLELGQSPAEYISGNVAIGAEAELAMVDRQYATIDTGSDDVTLNMRREPSTDADIMAKLPNGLELCALEVGDEWTKVSYNGAEGYLSNAYLRFETRRELETTLPTESYAENLFAKICAGQDGGKLEVREIDSADSAVIAELEDGKTVQILKMDENWSYIKFDDQYGYVLNRYLSGILENGTEE